jgi:hypothetical protein
MQRIDGGRPKKFQSIFLTISAPLSFRLTSERIAGNQRYWRAIMHFRMRFCNVVRFRPHHAEHTPESGAVPDNAG